MTTQTIEWEEEASRLFDQFDPDAARPVHGFQARRLRKASIEERARELGRSTVSGAMMNELLELQARWGWHGALSGYEASAEDRPPPSFLGMLGASDATEAARNWSASVESQVTEHNADFHVDVLGLGPGARVLELGCGFGQNAVPLAKRGFDVTALDRGEEWLAIAKALAKGAGVELTFVHADLLEFLAECEDQYDAVVSFATLFAGTNIPESEEQAQTLMDGIARVLSPGGRCFIGDCWETDTLMAARSGTMESGAMVHKDWGEIAPGMYWFSELRYRVAEARLYQRNVIIGWKDTPRERRTVTRIYTLRELSELCHNAGLVVCGQWCSEDWGAPYTDYRPDGGWLSVLARKEGPTDS
jgi:2-polyprenyl-3-methyl-5-hydroxy-6-metoxy-1,4-benzoquinol methylase